LFRAAVISLLCITRPRKNLPIKIHPDARSRCSDAVRPQLDWLRASRSRMKPYIYDCWVIVNIDGGKQRSIPKSTQYS